MLENLAQIISSSSSCLIAPQDFFKNSTNYHFTNSVQKLKFVLLSICLKRMQNSVRIFLTQGCNAPKITNEREKVMADRSITKEVFCFQVPKTVTFFYAFLRRTKNSTAVEPLDNSFVR